jgi:hypothetical protein
VPNHLIAIAPRHSSVSANDQDPETLFPVALAVLALAHSAFAQYGGQGLGSALSSDPLSHQGQVRAG